jgi:hypothetical protein
MELLNCPEKEIWDKRSSWIEDQIEQSIKGSHEVSDHATALFMDLQACYCAGAWLSVIILSVSVIDAHLRETEATNTKLGTAKLLDSYYFGMDDINWLRRLRNGYVHIADKPVLELNIQYDKRPELESDATRAIKMVIAAFFQSPGT